jgi:hypothetical protein
LWFNKNTWHELFVSKTQWYIYSSVKHSAKFGQSSRKSVVFFSSLKCNQINYGEEVFSISKKRKRKTDHLEYAKKMERGYA